MTVCSSNPSVGWAARRTPAAAGALLTGADARMGRSSQIIIIETFYIQFNEPHIFAFLFKQQGKRRWSPPSLDQPGMSLFLSLSNTNNELFRLFNNYYIFLLRSRFKNLTIFNWSGNYFWV